MKPRTIIIIAVIALAILGIVVYYLLHQSGTATTPAGQTGTLPGATTQQFPVGTGQNTTTTAGTTPGTHASSSGTFGIVSVGPVLDYFVDGQNNVTAIEPDGTIETVANGQVSIISSATIQNIQSAAFSYDGKKILVSFGSASAPQVSIFNVTTKSWAPSTLSMQSPVWSPNSYQVAYLKNGSAGTETIFAVNLTSATSTKITTLGTVNIEDAYLQWPNANTLIIADRPSVYVVSSAWAWNISAKTLTPLIYEYPGMENIWSNTTPMLGLVFSGNTGNQGGHLSLVESDGSQKDMTFDTLASKCTFDEVIATSTPTSTTSAVSATSKTITALTTTTTSSVLDLFCAVPRDQATFAIARLPDEYDQKVLFTADDFYEVNTASGALSTVFADPTQTLDASDLKVFNGILFFVNRYDRKLYGVKLQ